MTQIFYNVIVTILYESKEKEWLAWLQGHHIQDVLKGGASRASVIKRTRKDDDPGGQTYEIHYIFEDHKCFENYLEHHAPALRHEGLTKFPIEDGFHYQRVTGEIIS